MGIAGLDNIGNTYGAYNYTNRVHNNSDKSFGATIGNVTEMPSANLTLHISHEGDEEKSVSAWSDANAGRNVTVYQGAYLIENKIQNEDITQDMVEKFMN